MTNHKIEDEQLRVAVKPAKLAEAVESMTFNISDISADNKTAAIELAWANTSVKVGISTDFDKEVMADIAKKTKINPNNYAAAANYYFNSIFYFIYKLNMDVRITISFIFIYK